MTAQRDPSVPVPAPSTALRLTRAAAAAIAAASIAAASSSANAAPYTITTCGTTGKVGGWSKFGGEQTHLDVGAECPPSAPPGNPNSQPYRSGLYVTDRLATATDTPQGTRAGWQIEAPTGTTFTRAQWWLSMRKQDDDNYKMFVKYGRHDEPAPETWDCTIPVGYSACGGAGGWTWAPGASHSDSYVDVPGLDSDAISFGVRCADTPYRCMNGFTVQHARLLVYEARLTLDDPTAPINVAAGADAWPATEWQQGQTPVSVSGADPQSGIVETRVYVDGELTSSISRRAKVAACDWTMPTPCSNVTAEQPVMHAIDTTSIEDGEHELAVAVVNAAGVETRITRPVPLRVDNTAPAAPTDLTSRRRGTTNVFDIRWSLPVDAGSPRTTVRYQICAPACGATQNAPALTGVDGIALPSTSNGIMRVWSVDALGHEDSAAAATIVLPYLRPPTPPDRDPDPPGRKEPPSDGAPPTTPPDNSNPPGSRPPAPRPASGDPPDHGPQGRTAARLRLRSITRRPRVIDVRGTIARTATGRVTVIFTARRGSIVRRPAHIAQGAWRARLPIPARLRSSRATIIIRYGGSKLTKNAQVRRKIAATR